MTQAEFYASRRQALTTKYKGLIVITGSSFIQASADRPYAFEQDGNFFYLTGLEEPGLLLVIDESDDYLLIPDRSEARVAFEGKVDLEDIKKRSGIKNVGSYEQYWPKFENKIKELKTVGTLLAPGEYIAEADMFVNPSHRHLLNRLKSGEPKVEITDLRHNLTALRTVKTDYEINLIKKAISYTEELFEKLQATWPQAKTENELHALAVSFATENKLKFAYDPIIASGKNATTLHYIKNASELVKGQTLLLDIGLKFAGYSADITRTVCSNPSKRLQQVYDAVLDVQKVAIKMLKPGVILKEYEQEVLKIIEAKTVELGLEKTVRYYYPHSASHFLGIDVHDIGEYKEPLKENSVLTVEPGIYIPEENIGVRIEDDIVITKDGAKVLSNLPHNLSSLTMSS